MRRALAPLPAGQVQLQVRVPAGDGGDGRPGGGREGRPAEVRVEDDAGSVDHSLEPGGDQLAQLGLDLGEALLSSRRAGRPLSGQLLAQSDCNELVGVALLEPGVPRLVQKPPNCGQGLSPGYATHWPRMRYEAGA